MATAAPQARLDRHRPHGLRDGRAPRQGRRRRHGVEPHAREGRAARRGRREDRRPARRARRLRHRLRDGRRPGTTCKEVVAGPRGLLSGGKAPRMVVECSSISLEGSAELRALLAARGVDMLAAPVSGNAKVIKAGRLSFVCSGPRRPPSTRPCRCCADRAGGELRRRRRARAHRQDLPQRVPRRRDPVAGRDHRAGAEGRRAAACVPRVHEPERDGLDLLALQDAGAREPRLQGHVHAAAAAQGPRPGPRCRRASSGCRCRWPRSRATWCRR